MEVHRRHLAELGVLLVQVKGLRLADVGAASNGEVHHTLLFDLPDCLVDLAGLCRDLSDRLHGAVESNDLVFNLSRPQAKLNEVSDEMLVDNDELAG